MTGPQQLEILVDEYCDRQRHPGLRRFVVHDRQRWKGWWGSEMSSRAGCYVIFSEAGEAMYLGKASLKATIGSRLAVHEHSGHARWTDAAFVQMIEVIEPFEAPSLEEFLLCRLSTRYNKIGAIKPDLGAT